MKYIFLKKNNFVEPIKVLFLCGSTFSGRQEDKRVVVQDYLEQNSENRVIVLEKYFNFSYKEYKKDILSYYSFGLNNLYNIEMLAALVANKIIVLHESFSTAGEIGLFASNNSLRDKIITLAPERYSVEEEKISSFLKLAFWSNRDKIINNNVIRYYPVVEEVYVSEHRSIYHTYFYENKMPKNLGDLLTEKIGEKEVTDVGLKYEDIGELSFKVNLQFSALKNYIIALLAIPEFRKKMYECTTFSALKELFKTTFENVLKDTIEEKERVRPLNLKIILNKQNEFTFNKSVSFMILMLHSCGFINIVCEDEGQISVRHKKDIMHVIRKYSNLVKQIEPIEWGK